jgi:hypothetical protein
MFESPLWTKPRDALRLSLNGGDIEVGYTVIEWVSDGEQLIASLIDNFELRPVFINNKNERVLKI